MANQTIVPYFSSFVQLFAFNNADKTRPEQTAWKSRLIHQNQNVDGVAVAGYCSRQKAEIIGKRHPGGEDFAQREDLLIRVESIFISASLGRFNHDLKNVSRLVDRLEQGGIAHRPGRLLPFGHLVLTSQFLQITGLDAVLRLGVVRGAPKFAPCIFSFYSPRILACLLLIRPATLPPCEENSVR